MRMLLVPGRSSAAAGLVRGRGGCDAAVHARACEREEGRLGDAFWGHAQCERTSACASRSALANCVALLTSAQVSAVPCSSSTGGSAPPQATPCACMHACISIPPASAEIPQHAVEEGSAASLASIVCCPPSESPWPDPKKRRSICPLHHRRMLLDCCMHALCPDPTALAKRERGGLSPDGSTSLNAGLGSMMDIHTSQTGRCAGGHSARTAAPP